MAVWLVASTAALVLVVGALAAVVDADGGDPPQPGERGQWGELAAPAVPPDALASGAVVLAVAGGRLLAVADGNGQRPLQVWTFDGDAWSGPRPAPGWPRARATVVATPDVLVVWGGAVGGTVLNDGLAFDPATAEWREIARPPLPPRQGAAGIWTGRQIVVVGGDDGAGGSAPQAAAYDPVGDRWDQLPNADGLPGARVMSTAWTGGRAVLWAYDEAAHRSRLLALDVDAEVWSRVAPPPFDPANGASGLAGDPSGLVATTTGLDSVGAARLDPGVLAPAPPSTEGAGLAGTAGWHTLAAPPVPAGALCASELLHGGAGTVLLARCPPEPDEPFLLDGTTWRPLPPMPVPAAGPGTAVVADEALYYLAPVRTGAGGTTAPSLLRLPLR